MADKQQTKQVRNVLWCVPRSISTAMTRAMHNKPGCLTLYEPYEKGYYTGEERISKRFDGIVDILPNGRFCDVLRDAYEAEHSQYRVIFSKEMAYFVVHAAENGLYKLHELIPKNYVHTFLIRKPEKAIKSMYLTYRQIDGWGTWTKDEAGYRELYELYNYIKDNVDPKPLVLDADDFLADPVNYMQFYCNHLGIEFEDSMINWNPDDKFAEKLQLDVSGPWAVFWKGATSTTSFLQNPPPTGKAADEPLPPEVLQCIEECKPYYEKLLAVTTRL